nr:NADH dehydrogenase subunit 4L [Nothopoda sp.]
MYFWLMILFVMLYIFLSSFSNKFILLIVLELSYITFLMAYYFFYFQTGYFLFFLIFIVLDSMTLITFFVSMIRSSSSKNSNFFIY